MILKTTCTVVSLHLSMAFPLLRLVRTSVSIGSSSILSALVRVFAWVDLCGSDRNPGNPRLVGELDLDRKWIFTGNEIIM